VSSEGSAPSGDEGPAVRPFPLGALLTLAAVLGTISAYLAGRAELDPPVPDASEVVTDTDGTMWIPPEDAGPEDATAGGPGEGPGR
jgi:hypothetical protein